MPDWLPTRDTSILPFALNLSGRVSAEPGAFGFSVAEAAALAGDVAAYQAALAVALTPSTRTKTSVAGKDQLKGRLVATLRAAARRIRADPRVSSTQRTDLGLPIYPAGRRPVPPPATPPTLNLLVSAPLTQIVRIADLADPSKRGRPAGAFAAQVYAWVAPSPGNTPPPDLEQWRNQGVAKKNTFAVHFGQTDVGRQAFVVARWFNAKGQYGPVSASISAVVTGSLSAAA